MRINGYELNELYHFHVIDVNIVKENIFTVILLQLSEARSFHPRWEGRVYGAARGLWAQRRLKRRHSRSNHYQYPRDVSDCKELRWSSYRELPAVVSQLSKTPARSVITLHLTQPCWAPRLLLSLHIHSKYTDHCARLRKQGLCILAGGIYSERETNLLYLVFDGWWSRRNRGLCHKLQDLRREGQSTAWQRWSRRYKPYACSHASTDSSNAYLTNEL